MIDPLEAVFETPEESLARYLRSMPKSLIPVFEREFMRRPTRRAADVCPNTSDGVHPWREDSGGMFCAACGIRR